jgi:ATP-dependent helicase/nuclease subunit B
MNIIVVPSHRLAHHLQLQASNGTAVWEAEAIYTLPEFVAWLAEARMFQSDKAWVGRIITPQEERLIWQEIIARDTSAQLQDTQQLARFAASAWQTVLEWGIALHDVADATPEFAVFQTWLAEYQQWCDTHAVADWRTVFSHLIKGERIEGIAEISVVGFVTLPPQLQRFMAAHHIEYREKTCSSDIQVHHVKTATPEQECFAVASWAKQQLSEHDDTVAILVPKLAERKPALIQALVDLLLPEKRGLCEDSGKAALWNVSLGEPLADYAMVKAALHILHTLTNRQAVDYADISALLRSKYVCEHLDDEVERAILDCVVRKSVRPQITLDALARIIREVKPRWLWLEQLLKVRDTMPRQALPSVHVEYVTTLLQTAGFPGMFGTSARDHHILTALYQALDTVRGYDWLVGEVSPNRAVALFSQICQEQVVQPKTGFQPRIEIMEPEEALGLGFQHVWLMGADDRTYPGSVNPNPLLPLSLQQAYGVVAANAEKIYEASARLLASLEAQSGGLTYSWFAEQEGAEFLPSPLIVEYPLVEVEIRELATMTEEYETIDDGQGLLYTRNTLNNAVRFLGDQAACPLMAYAVHRLNAGYPSQPLEWFSPLERGIVVHQVMEWLGRDYPSSKQMVAVDDAVLMGMVERALLRVEQDYGAYPVKARGLEKSRVVRLVRKWLNEQESSRNSTILAVEEHGTLMIEGLTMQVRLDRIDAVAEDITVMDYKTGSTLPSVDWDAERITEPQLPLYALLKPEARFVAYAQLYYKDDLTLKIYPDKDKKTKTRPPLNHQALSQKFTTIIKEIQNGEAWLNRDARDVIINSDACGFCRIYEQD